MRIGDLAKTTVRMVASRLPVLTSTTLRSSASVKSLGSAWAAVLRALSRGIKSRR